MSDEGEHPAAIAQGRAAKRILKWIARGALILVALTVVTGTAAFYVGWRLLHPARKPITVTPAQYNLDYRTIRFPSRIDHLQLSGWLIPASSPSDKIVIQAHGYRQNRATDKPALPMAQALHRAGYSVLMFDFRGEGHSPGHGVTVGLLEQRDLLGAVDYARSLHYRHIGVIGYSMGASTALEAASADPSIDATVADSPFANLYSYLQRHMELWSHLPNWPFTPEVLWEMRIFHHLDARKVDPERDLANIGQHPILLIAGTADTTVPASNSEALAAALKHDRHARLWLVAGARHVGAYSAEPKRYTATVIRFFDEYLSH